MAELQNRLFPAVSTAIYLEGNTMRSVFFPVVMVVGVLCSQINHAHASWSDPTAGQYDGASTGSVMILVFGFAAFAFYKMVTRK